MDDSSTAQPNCKVYYSEFDNGIYFSLKILLYLWVSPQTYLLKKNYYKKSRQVVIITLMYNRPLEGQGVTIMSLLNLNSIIPLFIIIYKKLFVAKTEMLFLNY